jgi:hypothetical protein
MSVNQRIIKETQKLKKDPISGISAEPFSDNPRYFNVIITGPKDSPYDVGKFHLQLYLPEEYPLILKISTLNNDGLYLYDKLIKYNNEMNNIEKVNIKTSNLT